MRIFVGDEELAEGERRQPVKRVNQEGAKLFLQWCLYVTNSGRSSKFVFIKNNIILYHFITTNISGNVSKCKGISNRLKNRSSWCL